MLLAAFASGDMSRASSRLRSYYLFSLASDYGINVIRPKCYREAVDCAVIHNQKIFSYKMLLYIMVWRLFGKLVVTDIDDQPSTLKDFLAICITLFFSTVITVDTVGRKDYWLKVLPFKRIVVIPDIVDSAFLDITIQKRAINVNPKSFFWVGQSGNFASIETFAEMINNQSEYKLIVSSDSAWLSLYANKYPYIEFHLWREGIALSDGIDSKYMILSHYGGQDVSLKSDNKMVLAIINGYVPIVSNTPSYSILASRINAEQCVYREYGEIIDMVSNGNDWSVSYNSLDALGFIVENYSRASVLREFCGTVLNMSIAQ